MNIPTVIFINKIDQAGVDLQSVVQSVRDKLSADIIIKQTVSLSPEIVLEENTDIEAWDTVIENNDELLEKYIAGEPISREKLAREEQQRVQDASCSQSIVAAPKWPWHSTVDGCGDRAVPTDWGTGRRPYAAAFSRLSTPIAASGVSIYGYTAERCACRIRWPWPGRKAENHRDAYSIQRGNCSDRHRLSRVKLLSFQRQREVKRCIRGPNPAPS